MKLRIDVTQEDIESGTPNEPCSCPVALAMQRAGIEGASVWDIAPMKDGTQLGIEGLFGEQWFRMPAPEGVCRFVEAFDNDGVGVPSVAPFSFEVEL